MRVDGQSSTSGTTGGAEPLRGAWGSAAAAPLKEPHPAPPRDVAGLSAEVPKTTLTGGPGRPCSPVKPRWPFSPLSPASPVSPLSPRGPWGPWKGRRGRVRLRVADPPLTQRAPGPRASHRGRPQGTRRHSPACLERQRDPRDPWDLVHPTERKEGSGKGGRSAGCRGVPCTFGGVPATPELPCCQHREWAAAGTQRHL